MAEAAEAGHAKESLIDDHVYDIAILRPKDQCTREIDPQALSLHHSFGFESHKRYNVHYVTDSTVVAASGNLLLFLNIKTGEHKYYLGLRDGSIGAITVHPSKKYIAIGEIHNPNPYIFILEYPSLDLVRILREGSERGFSDLCFNASGDKLASVGCYPDYMLTIWNWDKEKIILRSKAFSQEVFRVSFAGDDGNLVTAGMGHIKFWRMSSTFTGLKLQGYIGKFGATELSDIAAFVQLPDGKVLSSTETGNLLLWDGGMIKCELARQESPCHHGRVEVVLLQDGEVITAGEDGYIRVWDFETIDTADVTSPPAASTQAPKVEGDEDGEKPPNAPAPTVTSSASQPRIFYMEPVDEIHVGKDVKIKSMVQSPSNAGEYLVQDQSGNLFRVDVRKHGIDKVTSFHSGPVNGVEMSPTSRAMVSLGADGTLRLHDYIKKSAVTKNTYPVGGTFLTYFPLALDGAGCTFAAGFEDGVLRILSHTPVDEETTVGDFDLEFVFKPHTAAIICVAISPDGSYMATSSKDKTIFFFKIDLPSDEVDDYNARERDEIVIFSRNRVRINPIGFIETDSVVTHMSFSPDNHQNIQAIEPFNVSESDEDDEYESNESISNSIRGRLLLVVKESGELISYEVPPPNSVDSSLTYLIPAQLVRAKSWMLDVPAPKIKPSDEKGKEGEKQQGKEGAEGAPAPAAGDQASVGQDAPNNPDGAAKPEDKSVENAEGADGQEASEGGDTDKGRVLSAIRKARGLVIRNDSPITAVLYLEGGYFLAAVINKDGETEVRALKFEEPDKSRLLMIYKCKIVFMRLSASRKYLLLGAEDGMTAIRKFSIKDVTLHKWIAGHETYEHYSDEYAIYLESDEGQLENFPGQAWIGHAHDCDRGKIASISLSFDDSFMCSSGHDGGLLVWNIAMEINHQPPEIPQNLLEKEDMEPVADITDIHKYSIQEAKIKSEHDREREEAEIKKQITRNLIHELRLEFLRLLAENDKSPSKIPHDHIIVDPNLRTAIEKRTEERIEMCKKELAWTSEREQIRLDKLKKKFLDDLQTERIVIKAFKLNTSVSTFRTNRADNLMDLKLDTATNNEKLGGVQSTTAQTKASTQAQDKGNVVQGEKKGATKSQRGPKDMDSKSKLEARKQLRAQRLELWKELMESKPDDKYEDPRDVAAIRYAETHMGDYKLKTGEKYIVPESERVDADKKKRQALLLRQSIYSLKEQFNKHVLRLRDRKSHLVKLFNRYNSSITQINGELRNLGETPNDKLWTPNMESSAYPENRYTVTSEDIVQFEQDEQEAAKRKAGESKGGGEENIFGTGTAAPAKDPTPVPPATDPPTTSQSSRPTSSSRSQQRSAESQNTSGLKTSRPNTAGSQKTTSSGRSGSAKSNAGRSNLEILQRDVRRRILKYKKERIKKAMELYIKEFDLTVDALAKERIILEGDVKSADIRLLLLYKEWALLKEFEKHDNFLADKRATKRLEKGEIDSKISECQEKLNSKKTEIEQAIKREKEIHEEFVKLIGENNKHEEFLTKIFKKKIKRSKKKIKTDGEDGENNEENESEEDEEDDDDMDSYDSADDDSDSEGEGAEECPPDYDQGHFNKILTLRERRLDQEDALAEIQKAIEAIKKENDSLLKKEKTIDAALKSTENEIQEFQTQKQQKLNELDVVIPLRLHQIQMLEQNAIPTDFSPALVFLGEGLVKLKNRIRELQQEKNDIKKSHKELKKMHVSLHKSRKEKLFKLQELEARAHDVQMLKFGQTIDLEKLERMGVNRSADELREKLQKEDNIRSKELGDWDLRIGHLKETLTDVTKDNTTRLEHLVGLSESRQQLEDALNTSQSSVTAEYSGPLQKDVIERRKLIKLVQAQEQEIGRLKQEIEVLIRKPLRQLPPVRYPVEQHGAAQDE